MKVKTAIILCIAIGISIGIFLEFFVLQDSPLQDDTIITFREKHFVIDIRNNPHLKGVKDVACYEFDPECGCDVEYTLQMKFNTYIPSKNQEYIFSGFIQFNIYNVDNIKKV